MSARIYTGAEALALLETIRDGGVPCAPDCNGACVVAYSRALMRLRNAAPGLAASVAHHEARAERAETLAQIHREERDACAAEVLRLRAEVDRVTARAEAAERKLAARAPRGAADGGAAVTPRFPGIVRQHAPAWDEYADALDLDELAREQSHCSPCDESFDGAPELCPSCGEDTLITTWGDAQAERFLNGDRYTAAGAADVAGWAPLSRYIGARRAP